MFILTIYYLYLYLYVQLCLYLWMISILLLGLCLYAYTHKHIDARSVHTRNKAHAHAHLCNNRDMHVKVTSHVTARATGTAQESIVPGLERPMTVCKPQILLQCSTPTFGFLWRFRHKYKNKKRRSIHFITSRSNLKKSRPTNCTFWFWHDTFFDHYISYRPGTTPLPIW